MHRGRLCPLRTNFYTSRAQFSPSELQDYLDHIPFPMLSDSHRSQLDAGITIEEVQAAIGGLQTGKTQGADGLPAKFYSQHVKLLAPRLEALFTRLAEADSLEEAIIVQIRKDVPPISLLNVDVKVMAKILALRLSSVISTLIHIDQTGFMPGKGTNLNIRRHFLNRSITHDNVGSRVVASLDAEKAFW